MRDGNLMLESPAFVGLGKPGFREARGAVAQLGERRVRNAKVEGSIPFRSTIFSSPGPASGARGSAAPVAQWIERPPPKR